MTPDQKKSFELYDELDRQKRISPTEITRLQELANDIKYTDLDKQWEDAEFVGPAVILGEGGAPVRTSILPVDATLRKNFPVASGVLDYFPDALVAISEISKKGNDQHNPGQSLRWTRSKSSDEADTCIRHFLQRGTLDIDGSRHTAKAAWRLLALLQKEIENESK